jgi:Ca2+-binding RTX toxin-like protein
VFDFSLRSSSLGISYGSTLGALLNSGDARARLTLPTDPLILDLNGDGVRLTDYLTAPVFFDVDNDGGSLEETGWVDASDGIVAIDLNNNGKIDNISETFSEFFGGAAGSAGSAGEKRFQNGFAALKSLDSNGDNVFDDKDDAWSSVQVWVDTNHDGKSWGDGNSNDAVDAGEVSELKSLSALGITQINLTHTEQSGEVRGGNEVLASGTFVQDGTTKEAIAANFLANPNGHTFTASATGTVVSTQGAEQVASVSAYVSSSAPGEIIDVAQKGVNNATGGSGDDVLLGDVGTNWLAGGQGSDTFKAGAGDDVLLIDGDDQQANIHGGDGTDIVQVVGERGVILNLEQADVEIAQGGRGNDVFIGGGLSTVYIRGGDGDDILIGGAASDALSGENGDDFISGGSGNDVLRGHRGRDQIMGGLGNDLIDGGLDDDHLSGGGGDDVLIGGAGDDSIDGGDGVDVVELAGVIADYRIIRTSEGVWLSDKISGRDGTDFLRNVEKISFKNLKLVDIVGDAEELESPLVTRDVLSVDKAGSTFGRSGKHLIGKEQLLSNDIDWQNDTLRISELFDVTGGRAELTEAGDVLFIPELGFTGIMGFKYTVVDQKGNSASTIVDVADGKEATMRASVSLRTPDLPSDPLVTEQWYLSQANVLPVWKEYTGSRIRIGQFEPSNIFGATKEILDYRHPDLKANINEAWLANAVPGQRAGEGSDGKFSDHATLVAGVMVAARNGEGIVGVAYNASIGGHWLNKDDLSSLNRMHQYDVVNNSWGSNGRFSLRFNPAALGLMPAAYNRALSEGRDGLGTVIVTASGNSRALGGNTNYSNVTNSRSSIIVGAINAQDDLGALQRGGVPFSTPGANILVSAPGSNITSTSRLIQNDNGSLFGADNSTSQGTSFATPIVSGIVALMLEANDTLGYRDIQEILALSARKVADPTTHWQFNGSDNWNNGGMHVSHDYGYGAVDALAAVRLAETWTSQRTRSNEFLFGSPLSSGEVNLGIPDAQPGGLLLVLSAESRILRVEHAEIRLSLSHQRPGDLIIKLISPAGTESILMDRPGKVPGATGEGSGDVTFAGQSSLDYVFSTALLRGESATGDWKLQIIDSASGATGTLHNWSLNLYGSGTLVNDQYVFTNEYAQLAAQGRDVLEDLDGGADTINAAAISQKSIIDLSKGIAQLAGAQLTIVRPEAIENAIGGEFADELIGNAFNNRLLGGNGDDLLSGGAGRDLLLGGRGNDTLSGGADRDYFVIERQPGSNDTIQDFELGLDKLVLADFYDPDLNSNDEPFGNGSFSMLNMQQQGNDTLLNISGLHSVRLQNVDATQLRAENFIFLRQRMSLAEINHYESFGFGITPNEIALPDTATGGFYQVSSAAQTVFGGQGGDSIRGGGGNDVLVGDRSTAGDEGGDDYIDGRAGNDVIRGGGGNDTLKGGGGNDYVNGDAGDDVLYLEGDQGSFETGAYVAPRIAWNGARLTGAAVSGGAGNDRFVVGKAAIDGFTVDLLKNLVEDFEVDNPLEKIDLSSLNGIRSLTDLAFSEVQVNGEAYLRVWLGAGAGAFITLKGVNAAQLSASNFIFSTQASNTSTSPVSSGVFAGKEINITVTNPQPIKRQIDSSLIGELHATTSSVAGGGDALLPDREGGTIYWANDAGERVFGGQGGDLIRGGIGNDVLVGEREPDSPQGGSDRIFGGAGNDVLRGGGGNDTLRGEAGFDYLSGDAGDDTLYLDGDQGAFDVEGLDTSAASLTFTGVRFTGAAVSGGEGNDRFVIDDASSKGLLGNLILDLEVANADEKIDLKEFDHLHGFADLSFSDLLIDGQQYLRVWLGQRQVGTSYFTLKGVEAAQLSAHNFIFADVFAEAVNDPKSYISRFDGELIGDAGGNTLSGWDGSGTMEGRSGDDTYIVDDAGDLVKEVAGGGYDWVQAYISYQLPEEVEVLELKGWGGVNLNGTGNSLANRLIGNSGANTLDGGAGADVMLGGQGNDTYVVDDSADRVIERANEGVDTVKASVSFTLSEELENLTLTGDQSINATGNAMRNLLIGNRGNNRLDGAKGADTMQGGKGDDLYFVDDLGDVVMENPNEGVDRVISSVNMMLSSHVEELELIGMAREGTGNDLDNTLLGNALNNLLNGGGGNDWLAGGVGNDKLRGGKGNDYLLGGDGSDAYYFAAGDGQDTINNLSNTPADNDILSIEGITRGNLWLSRQGDSLVIDVRGSADSVTVQGWYTNSAQRLDAVQAGGSTLYANQVDNLVSAMAAFGAPAGGEINLSQVQRDQLNAVIAANWQ